MQVYSKLFVSLHLYVDETMNKELFTLHNYIYYIVKPFRLDSEDDDCAALGLMFTGIVQKHDSLVHSIEFCTNTENFL